MFRYYVAPLNLSVQSTKVLRLDTCWLLFSWHYALLCVVHSLVGEMVVFSSSLSFQRADAGSI